MAVYQFSIDQIEVQKVRSAANHADNDWLTIIIVVNDQVYQRTERVGGVIFAPKVFPGFSVRFLAEESDVVTIVYFINNLGATRESEQFQLAIDVADKVAKQVVTTYIQFVQQVAPGLIGALIPVVGPPLAAALKEIGPTVANAVTDVVTSVLDKFRDLIRIFEAPNCDGEVLHDSLVFPPGQLNAAVSQGTVAKPLQGAVSPSVCPDRAQTTVRFSFQAISANNEIFQLNRGRRLFEGVLGRLAQVAVGADGEVWGINTSGEIFRFNGDTRQFKQVPGQLAQIAVGNAGEVWGINPSGEVFQATSPKPIDPSHQADEHGGHRFGKIPGELAQIAAGNTGEVWGINPSGEIFRFNSSSHLFEQISGNLAHIAVGKGGDVWGINPIGQIFRLSPARLFEPVPGRLVQIAVGDRSAVWGINQIGEIFRLNPTSQLFEQVPGQLARVAVGADNVVWGINPSGEIFLLNPASQLFEQVPGCLAQIAVGNAGAVWGIN